ncbi:MAG: AAA family ATPase, partial [Candidatus Hydrothermae bacterium]|nr:AAA family ATPase [Candidatus Hydrothermae bacterium]
VALRIGVHTGTLIYGEVASGREWTVLGDTVNVAKRLQEAAPPGGVMLSESSLRFLRGRLETAKVLELQLKGKSEPVRAVQVTNWQPFPRHLSRTPLTGRKEELAQVFQRWEDTLRRGQQHELLISGPSGIGKTRLAIAFLNRLTSRDVRTMEIYPYTTGTPEHFLLQRVLEHVGVQVNHDPLEVWKDRLREILDDAEGTRAEVMYRLLHGETDALPVGAGELFQLIRGWFRILLRHLVGAGGGVLFVDDVDRLDAESLQLLRDLLDTPLNAPLFLLMTSREIPFQGVDALKLRPLHRSAQEQLLERLLASSVHPPALPVRRRMLRLSRGIPLYLELLVDMWHNEPGALEELPESLQMIVYSWIDRIPVAHRSVLQKLSVAGEVFPTPILEHLLQQEEHPSFQELVRKGWFVTVERTYLDHPGYRFRDPLLRESLYTSMLRRDRRRLHTTLYRWVETSRTRLNRSLTASEWMWAGWHAEGAGDSETALLFYREAADAAWKSYRLHVALEALHRALGLTHPEQPISAELRLMEARILEWLGEETSALERLQQVQKMHASTTSARVEAALREGLLRLRHDPAAGRALLEELVDRTDPASLPPVLQLRLKLVRGMLAYLKGDLTRARTYFEEVLAQIPSKATEGEWEAVHWAVLNNLGSIAAKERKPKEALHYFSQAYRISHRSRDLRGILQLSRNIAFLHRHLGELDRADQTLARAQELARNFSMNRDLIQILRYRLGLAMLQVNRERLRWLDRWLRDHPLPGAEDLQIRLALALNRYEEARARLRAWNGPLHEQEELRWMLCLEQEDLFRAREHMDRFFTHLAQSGQDVAGWLDLSAVMTRLRAEGPETFRLPDLDPSEEYGAHLLYRGLLLFSRILEEASPESWFSDLQAWVEEGTRREVRLPLLEVLDLTSALLSVREDAWRVVYPRVLDLFWSLAQAVGHPRWTALALYRRLRNLWKTPDPSMAELLVDTYEGLARSLELPGLTLRLLSLRRRLGTLQEGDRTQAASLEAHLMHGTGALPWILRVDTA